MNCRNNINIMNCRNNIMSLLTDINSPFINGQYYTIEEQANDAFIMIISTVILIIICSILNFV